LREAFLENQRRTIHNVYKIVGLSFGKCQPILSDALNEQRIAAKFVQRMPSKHQNEYRIAVCTELKKQPENGPNFISKVITSDESWMFGHDPKKTQQSS
jgi:hypothetical protein